MGYMAKRVEKVEASRHLPPHIEDICSASGCISYQNFCDFIDFWKHNGWWFFDSPQLIREVADEAGVGLEGTTLFYYEVFEKQFNQDKGGWEGVEPEWDFGTDVKVPKDADRQFFGYDIVTYYVRTTPGCSPLSCNGMAEEIPANKHCLLDDFDEAKRLLESGAISYPKGEPGPYRIISVYRIKEKSNG